MGRRGRKRRLGIEDEYWQLILAGTGTVEACQRVGVGRKTGYRWRAERGGLPPLRLAETCRGERYLTLLERQRIATLHRQQVSIREISRRLGRAPSTISRELRRNVAGHDVGGYDGDLAHSRARQRESGARVREGKLAANRQLRALVVAKLELDWSPEQIAAWLLETHPNQPELWVCHETIYQALYHGGRGGLSRRLTIRLRTGRPMRKRRRRPHERTPRFVAPAQLIENRPPIAELRTRLGDWEGDLIIGRSSQSAIGTLVCRRTRYLKLIHLPDGHTAEDLLAGMRLTMAGLPTVARMTLTWDQGSEMASHDKIASMFSQGVFFAHAGKPWQRGTNENTNGLARQYFPKGIDLGDFTSNDLLQAEDRLNNRPRKTLGWQTPAAALAAALASP